MANYTKINLDLQSDLVLSNAKIDAVTGGLRSELDGILSSASAEETRALAAEAALDVAAQGYADDAEAAANQHTNNREVIIKAYADQAELDAIASAEAKDVARAATTATNLSNAISTEVSNRDAAILVEKNRAEGIEGGLQTAIDNLVIDSQDYADAAVLVEKDRAEAAELALSNQIADVISNVDPAALDSLSEIVAAFQSADGDLSAAITSALGTHTSELAIEIADRIAGDAATLAAAKVYTDALENGTVKANTIAINAEVIRAKAAELVNANNIVSGDATTLASGKTYADGKVATEKAERIADVNAEQTRAEGAEDSLGMDIANETERAMLAESGLQSSINTLTVDAQDYADAAVLVEKNRAEGVEAGLASDISAEEDRAMTAEAGLATDIQTVKDAVSDEEVRAMAAESAISNDLDFEVTRAVAAELVLTNNLAAEVTRATAKEGVLSGEILAEETRAIAAEAVLDGKIGTEKGRIDAILSASSADKDSFAEIVTLINSVDTANDNAFGGYVTSNNAALATEKSDRIQGDSDLNDKIGVEASRAEAAELVLDGKINAEKVRATAAEGVNAAAIVTEKNRAEAAELVLTNGLADEKARAIAAEGVNADAIVTEKNRAIAAEGVLTTAVADEVIRAKAAEGDLQTAIDNLVTDSQDYADAAVAALKQEVDDSVEKILDLDFKSMFAQKIGATTEDNQKYRLDKAVMGESLQVFENGLLLEEGADYSVNYTSGVNDAKEVVFGYQIKPDWKVKFFGVPFVASDVDLIAG